MPNTIRSAEGPQRTVLVNYLTSMARRVEIAVHGSIDALLDQDETIANQVFLLEPGINEMEIRIDEHAVRMFRAGNVLEEDIRLIVASVKVNKDLERIGDLAFNIAQRVVSLSHMKNVESPPELEPMSVAVRTMLDKSLRALIQRNLALANEVLESDDLVDNYYDQVFEQLLVEMTENPFQVQSSVQFLLASRYLERIADHATNIAEEVIFWIRGLDVRHGLQRKQVRAEESSLGPVSPAVTESS